jgi:hypothetical protein
VSAIEELRSYVEQLRRRFRLGAVVRGTAVLAAVALVATIFLTASVEAGAALVAAGGAHISAIRTTVTDVPGARQ